MANPAAANMAIEPGLDLVDPLGESATTTTSATAAGTANRRRRFLGLVRRQATAGPRPESSTSTMASGAVYRLNHPGPTASLCPVRISEISGKNVPQKITAHRPTRIRLLNRK